MSGNNVPKSKGPSKKRTIYEQKGALELPEWAKNDKTHKYRWTSKRKAPRSDGFDPRGWSVARDPSSNESLEVHDVILSRMPLDEWDSMKEYKDTEARNLVKDVAASLSNKMDQLRYEIEKIGGRIEGEFSVDNKN